MTSLHVICGLPPPNEKSWLRLCLEPFAISADKEKLRSTSDEISITLF